MESLQDSLDFLKARSSRSEMFCGTFKNFAKFTRKHLCRSLYFNKVVLQACYFIKKETLAQLFSCESCKIFKNSFFIKKIFDSSFWISMRYSIDFMNALAEVVFRGVWQNSSSENFLEISRKITDRVLFQCKRTPSRFSVILVTFKTAVCCNISKRLPLASCLLWNLSRYRKKFRIWTLASI